MCNTVLLTRVVHFFLILQIIFFLSPHKNCTMFLKRQTQPKTNIVFGLWAHVLVAMCVQKSRSAAARASTYTCTHTHTHTTWYNQVLSHCVTCCCLIPRVWGKK